MERYTRDALIVLMVCLTNIVICYIFSELAEHFNQWWLSLLALLFFRRYGIKPDKTPPNHNNKNT